MMYYVQKEGERDKQRASERERDTERASEREGETESERESERERERGKRALFIALSVSPSENSRSLFKGFGEKRREKKFHVLG